MAHAAAYTTADATAACSAVAVVIPCYKVATHILPLLARIGPEVAYIIVVDDACPEGSGDVVKARCTDPRVEVVFHPRNLGVGGAVITGYQRARRTKLLVSKIKATVPSPKIVAPETICQ